MCIHDSTSVCTKCIRRDTQKGMHKSTCGSMAKVYIYDGDALRLVQIQNCMQENSQSSRVEEWQIILKIRRLDHHHPNNAHPQ